MCIFFLLSLSYIYIHRDIYYNICSGTLRRSRISFRGCTLRKQPDYLYINDLIIYLYIYIYRDTLNSLYISLSLSLYIHIL